MNGHTANMQLGVNPNLDDDMTIGVLCQSDTGILQSDGKAIDGITTSCRGQIMVKTLCP
jgi:hypothetical protein